MRPFYLIIAVIWTMGSLGCAGVPVSQNTLLIEITPEVIAPGDIIKVLVTANRPLKKVTGRMEILGSPVLPLKPTIDQQHWIFETQIPLGAVWQPGEYKVIVEGVTITNEVLLGTAWIKAP